MVTEACRSGEFSLGGIRLNWILFFKSYFLYHSNRNMSLNLKCCFRCHASCLPIQGFSKHCYFFSLCFLLSVICWDEYYTNSIKSLENQNSNYVCVVIFDAVIKASYLSSVPVHLWLEYWWMLFIFKWIFLQLNRPYKSTAFKSGIMLLFKKKKGKNYDSL